MKNRLTSEIGEPLFSAKQPFRILSLDGGGSKGVYTLGVLKEFEAVVGCNLAEHFDLMYGTSTGAIIVALLGLGVSVSEIEKRYFDLIPKVMRCKLSWTRTAELRKQLQIVFGDRKFDDFTTHIGIVATNYEREKPLILKTSEQQAFRGRATFMEGFGVNIADALLASAAAFPFFRRFHLETVNAGNPEVMDGGFVANNPTLFAIADALQTIGASRNSLKILSVGVGHYSEPQRTWYSRVIMNFFPFKMMEKEFLINANTIEILRNLFFADIHCVRIDDAYPDRQYSTDLMEANISKLRKLFVLGQESFRKHENDVRNYLSSEDNG